MCDTVAITTATGTWFAKNSDRSANELQVVEASPRRPGGGTLHTQYLTLPDPGAHAILGCRPIWLRGLEMGVNDHGVAIGNEKVWTTDPIHRAPEALLGMDLVRLALERADDADDGLTALTTALEAHGQGGNGEFDHHEAYTSSFLIADARGGWHVETRGRSWAAAPIDVGVAISNRVSMRNEWTRASADVAPDTDIDTWRHPAVDVRIAEGRLAVTRGVLDDPNDIDERRLFALLRDHTGVDDPSTPGRIAPVPAGPGLRFEHLSVCMHHPEASVTTASLVAHLPRDAAAPIRIWCAVGSPCASVFVPIDPAAPPGGLGAPALAERFRRLRTLVESDATALDEVRSVLGPLEDDLLRRGPGPDPGPAIERALEILGV